MKLSTDKLIAAPELAPLAVLDATLHVVVLALAAAWPELHTGDLAHHESRAALEVIELARALAIALRRYRRAIGRQRQIDLPF